LAVPLAPDNVPVQPVPDTVAPLPGAPDQITFTVSLTSVSSKVTVAEVIEVAPAGRTADTTAATVALAIASLRRKLHVLMMPPWGADE
jgi:hypothetical protein